MAAIYDQLAALLARQSIPTRYRLDLPALLSGLLPTQLRRPRLVGLVGVRRARLVGLLEALLSPMAEVYYTYLSYTLQVQRRLTYSGQKLAFERALNDRFDPDQARIQLLDSDTQLVDTYLNFEVEDEPPVFVRLEQEGPPYRYLYDWSELANQVGFLVRVPASLQPREAAIHARIRELKLALVRYSIIYF